MAMYKKMSDQEREEFDKWWDETQEGFANEKELAFIAWQAARSIPQ